MSEGFLMPLISYVIAAVPFVALFAVIARVLGRRGNAPVEWPEANIGVAQIRSLGFASAPDKQGRLKVTMSVAMEPDLKFGNILSLGMPELASRGGATIRTYENNNPALSRDCIDCEYFYLCHAGCPIQRNNTQENKAYTCGIQKALYRAQPHRFPPKPATSRRLVDAFIRQNQPRIYDDHSVPRIMEFNAELFEEKNAITAIIERDPKLAVLFRKGAVRLHVNDVSRDLFSSRLYGRMTQVSIAFDDVVKAFIADDLWALNAADGAINAVRVQLLRDNPVVYGDEARTKMEHVATTDFYEAELERVEGGWLLDLTRFLAQYQHTFFPGYGNLLSITTIKARDYHYSKHAKNAFYNLETVNLPFHEFRFSWSSCL